MKSVPNLPASSRMQMPSGGGSVKTPTKNGAASAAVKSAGVSGGLLKAASKAKGMKKK
jgi:hypothetical protein